MPSHTPASKPWGRSFIWALLGVLLLQAAWSFVVPPFRGLDEHDHAYKAAAVARGDWSASHTEAPGGWGELVTVPADLVVAAGPVCETFPYTTKDNCSAVRDGQDAGTVEVASSAARYNPVFYFAIGTPARFFSGSDALYAMRATGALICALLIALAISTAWSSSRWPAAAVLVAATPVMLYSTTIAAPNGVEMSGALLVWSALLSLARSPGPAPPVARFVILATVGAIPLVTVRSLGPLWLLLIVAVCALLTPREIRSAVLRSTTARVCALAVAVATSAAVAWTLTAGTNQFPSKSDPITGLWADLPKECVLWLLQAIGAFPARDEPAPALVYAVVLAAWAVLTIVGWRAARRRERLLLVVVFVLAYAVPLAATISSYEDLGPFWQGRYGYPFAVGFLLIAGHVLALRDNRASRASRALPVLVAGAVVAVTQPVSQLGVLGKELGTSPLAGSDAWLTLPSPVVVVLSVAGAVAVTVAGLRSGTPDASAGPSAPETADLASPGSQPRVAATQR